MLNTVNDAKNIQLDRTHRFEVGDSVRHVDTADIRDRAEVEELTLRIVANVAYPTYTLRDRDGEVFGDVLCTRDLVGSRSW